MTVINDFDISKNLKVEFFIPNVAGNFFIIGISLLGSDDELAGVEEFIIGTSLLGGTDQLAPTGEIPFVWTEYECSVSKAELSIGGSVQDSLYFQPQPSQLSLTMQNLAIDPTQNRLIRPGVSVRIRLVKGDYEETLFQGTLDKINVGYDTDNRNIMQFTAYDSFKKFVNARLGTFDTTDPIEYPDGYATPYEVIEQLADLFGTAMHASSEALPGEIPGATYDEFIPTGVLYEAIKVGLGIFWVDQATKEFVVIPRPTILDGTGAYTVGNQHDEPLHLCMSRITANSDIDKVYNSLKVSLKGDEAISTTIKNQDSIDLYGEFSVDTTLDTTDVEELNRWATAVFNQTSTKLIDSVETPAIDRLGNLTHAAIFKPGETVNIDYQTGQLDIQDTYTITKVSHSIDVNNWFTTIDLWKEY